MSSAEEDEHVDRLGCDDVVRRQEAIPAKQRIVFSVDERVSRKLSRPILDFGRSRLRQTH